jgi:hypothetical protein
MTTNPQLLAEINAYVDEAAAHGECMIPVRNLAADLADRYPERPLGKIEEKIRDRIRAHDLYAVD